MAYFGGFMKMDVMELKIRSFNFSPSKQPSEIKRIIDDNEKLFKIVLFKLYDPSPPSKSYVYVGEVLSKAN